MKTVTFVYPINPNHPIGGLKVIYDYANYLVDCNINVNIVYAAFFETTEKSINKKIKAVLKYLYTFYRRFIKCSWFPVKQQIKELYVWEINDFNIPKSDVYIATSANSAFYIDRLKVPPKNKFYFIQGFEDFILPSNEVVKTYSYSLKKIAIANWLKKIIESQKQSCVVVPNGFHFDEYKVTIPIEEKKKNLISILYHASKTKDFNTGLEALKIAKNRHSNLEVIAFGVYDRPSVLPKWIKYIQNPSLNEHLEINNLAAIHVGTSKKEGWGLTIGEAMMCGQAVVCTDNDGYKEMAIDGRNALLSPVGDSQALAENICKLLSNDALRIQLAKQGVMDIAQFDIKKSYKKFFDALDLNRD